MGSHAFSRVTLSKELNRTNPGSVGYRDDPYKSTRAIYVLQLPTLHTQIAVISHMVNYVSSNTPSAGGGYYD